MLLCHPWGKTQRKEHYFHCSGGDEVANVLSNGVQQEGKSPGNDLIALGSVSAPPKRRHLKHPWDPAARIWTVPHCVQG